MVNHRLIEFNEKDGVRHELWTDDSGETWAIVVRDVDVNAVIGAIRGTKVNILLRWERDYKNRK